MRGLCRCRNGGKKNPARGLSLKKGGTQPLNARKSFVSRNSSPTTRLMRASIACLSASYRLCHCALLLRASCGQEVDCPWFGEGRVERGRGASSERPKTCTDSDIKRQV